MGQKFDKFDGVIQKITNADDIRISQTDVTTLRQIQKKVEILHELMSQYVPETSRMKREAYKAGRKGMTRSQGSSSEFFSTTQLNVMPEYVTNTQDLIELMDRCSKAVLIKLDDLQKIRIGCLNSEITGVVMNYLFNHIMSCMLDLDCCVGLLCDKTAAPSNPDANASADPRGTSYEHIRQFGKKADLSKKHSTLIEMVEEEISAQGFAEFSEASSKKLAKIIGMEGVPSSSSTVQPATEEHVKDRFFGHRHETANFVMYFIGCNTQRRYLFPTILSQFYHTKPKIKAFVGYFFTIFGKHLFEFMMERTNQYFLTWMLFNVEMLLTTHMLPLWMALVEQGLSGDSELQFLDSENPQYLTLKRDHDDFICHQQDKTFIMFPEYGCAFGIRRLNTNFYPLYTRVSSLRNHRSNCSSSALCKDWSSP